MLRGLEAAANRVSAASTPVKATLAAGLNPANTLEVPVSNEAKAPTPSVDTQGPAFRYNSFEFVYRQDVGRIVLVGQSPETGEKVLQVPSERALRAYVQSERVAAQLSHLLDVIEVGEGAVFLAPSAQSSAPAPTPTPTPAPPAPTPAAPAAPAATAQASGLVI